ncbi:hypothetical protein C8R47DRAFT_1216878 [Mycena vitilis]|nr:hypothetical protein C8R47DRAFT_1216873 [Mycena vitilis]KAJ6485314.1 hypothetical protein C8R47DRAFT_1216878 [Mycena vitilis]
MLFAASVVLSAILAVSSTPLSTRQGSDESFNGQTVSIVAHQGSVAWTYSSQLAGTPLTTTEQNGTAKGFLLQTVNGQNDSTTVIMTPAQQQADAPTVVSVDPATNQLGFVAYARTNPPVSGEFLLECPSAAPTGPNGLASQCTIFTQGKCVKVATAASGQFLTPAECDDSASQTWDLVKL